MTILVRSTDVQISACDLALSVVFFLLHMHKNKTSIVQKVILKKKNTHTQKTKTKKKQTTEPRRFYYCT